MKTLISTIFLVLTTMSFALALGDLSSSDNTYTPLQQEEQLVLKNDNPNDTSFSGAKNPVSVQGTSTNSRFLASSRMRRPVPAMTCDKYPRICRSKGSVGPDCCKRRCVDTSGDRLNCGMCGKKCKFWEICCRGKCVNPKNDEKNCGSCQNRCKKGSSCDYGMCSYAN